MERSRCHLSAFDEFGHESPALGADVKMIFVNYRPGRGDELINTLERSSGFSFPGASGFFGFFAIRNLATLK